MNNETTSALLPSDTVVRKTASDSFFGANLESILRERGVRHLIVAGCMTGQHPVVAKVWEKNFGK